MKKLLTESTTLSFGGYRYIFSVGAIDSGNKQGFSVRFIPEDPSPIDSTRRDAISVELQKRLQKILEKRDLSVERDRQLRDKNVIGFVVYREFFAQMILKGLTEDVEESDEIDVEHSELDLKNILTSLEGVYTSDVEPIGKPGYTTENESGALLVITDNYMDGSTFVLTVNLDRDVVMKVEPSGQTQAKQVMNLVQNNVSFKNKLKEVIDTM